MQLSGLPTLLSGHGETVSYTPKGGAATSITAVVNREPLQVPGSRGDGYQEYPVSILVSRLDVATLVVGGDTVGLKKRVTDSSNTTYTVKALLSQEGGAWRLGLAG